MNGCLVTQSRPKEYSYSMKQNVMIDFVHHNCIKFRKTGDPGVDFYGKGIESPAANQSNGIACHWIHYARSSAEKTPKLPVLCRPGQTILQHEEM